MSTLSTLREWFNDEKADWSTLTLIHQPVKDGDNWPGWGTPVGAVSFSPEELAVTPHAVLDYSFDSGYGGPKCPRFIAQDKTYTYFPYQYDGATGMVKILRDLKGYMDFTTHETPYPGG